MIAQETNGSEVPPDRDLKLTITADAIIAAYPEGDPRQEQVRTNGMEKAAYRLDPSREPKTIDLVGVIGPRKGTTTPGIYRLDGDTLEICLDLDGQGRPSAFDTTPGDHDKLMVFRREIPISVPASPAPASARAAGTDDARRPVLEFRIVADAAHDRAAAELASAPTG